MLQESCIPDYDSFRGGNRSLLLIKTDVRAKRSCGPWLLDEPVDLVVQRLHLLLRRAGLFALLLESSMLLFANSGTNHVCECARQSVDERTGSEEDEEETLR